MQREIKFRVWDILERIFLHKKGINTIAFNTDGLFFPYGTGKSNLEWTDRFIIQQYTGLKDKNGQEIYEGDILERIGNGSFCKIVIYWDEQNCRFISRNVSNLHGEGFPISNNSINISDWTYWVVCGNIYENPELLKN